MTSWFIVWLMIFVRYCVIMSIFMRYCVIITIFMRYCVRLWRSLCVIVCDYDDLYALSCVIMTIFMRYCVIMTIFMRYCVWLCRSLCVIVCDYDDCDDLTSLPATKHPNIAGFTAETHPRTQIRRSSLISHITSHMLFSARNFQNQRTGCNLWPGSKTLKRFTDWTIQCCTRVLKVP